MSDDLTTGSRHHSLENTTVRVVSAHASLPTRLTNLWSRRELLAGLISSDIRIKYKNSALGLFWSMLNPAFTLAIYFLVFAEFLKNGIPNFVIYLFSGLVVWNMFQNSINAATGVIVDRAALVKKVSFPREILALSNVGAAGVYFVIQLGILVVFVAALGHAPAWKFLLILPISFCSLYLLTSALAVILSAVNVYFRDMRHLMEVLLQLWFWLTPVVYSYENSIASILSNHHLNVFYFLNPVTLIVVTMQRVFYVKTIAHSTTGTHQLLHLLPTWSFTTFLLLNVLLLGITAIMFLLAEVGFGRLEGNFESEL